MYGILQWISLTICSFFSLVVHRLCLLYIRGKLLDLSQNSIPNIHDVPLNALHKKIIVFPDIIFEGFTMQKLKYARNSIAVSVCLSALTRNPVELIPGSVLSGSEWSRREVYRLSLLSAEVINEWSSNPFPPYAFMAWTGKQFTLNKKTNKLTNLLTNSMK